MSIVIESSIPAASPLNVCAKTPFFESGSPPRRLREYPRSSRDAPGSMISIISAMVDPFGTASPTSPLVSTTPSIANEYPDVGTRYCGVPGGNGCDSLSRDWSGKHGPKIWHRNSIPVMLITASLSGCPNTVPTPSATPAAAPASAIRLMFASPRRPSGRPVILQPEAARPKRDDPRPGILYHDPGPRHRPGEAR